MSRAIGRCQRGYTMAELLVTAAVIAFIMAALMGLLLTDQQTYVAGANRAEAQQSARLVIARMIQEIRTGGQDPLATATFSTITALAPPDTGFVVANDWNGNGAIEAGLSVLVDGALRGEQITYTVTGNSLTRQESFIDGSAVEVTSAINSITFQYFDADDNVVVDPHVAANAVNVRTLVITVTANPDTSGTATTQAPVTTQNRVRIRNR
jgi:prepilin-type N-terminal cleavage/methylation domain-containing protein